MAEKKKVDIKMRKRVRQTKTRTEYNSRYKSKVKTVIKKLLKSIEAKNADASAVYLKEVNSVLSKAANRNILNKKTASRKLAGLSKKVSTLKAKASK